jgi:hypothetical protein
MSKLESRAVARLIVIGIEWKCRSDDGPVGDVKTYFAARKLTQQGRSKEAQALYKAKRIDG